MEKSQEFAYNKLAYSLNGLSVVASLLIVFTVLAIFLFHRKFADRVSFRLAFLIALSDIGYHTSMMAGYHSSKSDFSCVYSTWGSVYFNLMFIFLTATIAFNLQIVFIHGKQNIRQFETTFVLISVCSALFLSGWPLVLGKFGFDPKFNSCWYLNQDDRLTLIWLWCTFYFWVVASVIYSLLVVIFVARRLLIRKRQISQEQFSMESKLTVEQCHQLKLVNYAVSRILAYAIVPIITQSSIFVASMYGYTHGEIPFAILIMAATGPGLQGVLNAIAFTFDPALWALYHSTKTKCCDTASSDSFKQPSLAMRLHLDTSSRFDTLSIDEQLRAL
ncbi:hypothetical protein K493DRAFT_337405 [Basidiobolus meristosporus CBS 931.73]|uniref:G-protein coupled receptors family 1 profile domain-containing protein n=1 Tax=Basidiobolus meristosporus CBS 931.73 TaxID=1314790 RepID=A0A1Y1YBA8_9FUNG|nr:hypothetical protein K493DRAFT_337405 [Basidiobolus meristosporus CBS 931.73]|eukprot:ORX95289.1 hypothetical protein K493DRAFT_337405 [Basidiobolus meristosporus CBS 931.73]